MTDQHVLHPVFGRSVKNGATDTCSKCGHSIPEDAVPLMMWDADDKTIMWVFCEGCDPLILSTVKL